MKIKVYTTKSCVYCHALLDWLDEEGIKYEEVNAEEPENVKDMEIYGVPVTIIENEGEVFRVDGFDRPAIKKILRKLGRKV